MNNTFTLIAYRPDGYDDGCSSDSNLTIMVCKSLDELVKAALNFYFDDNKDKCGYEDWELTILIDGKEQSYDEEDEVNVLHMELRETYEKMLKEAIKVKKELIIEEERIAEEERKIRQREETILNKQRDKEYKLSLYKQLQRELGIKDSE